jgi:hypothetical protein
LRYGSKGAVTLFRYAATSVLGGRNRARRARFPVPDVVNASQSSRRGAPSSSLRRLGFRFASRLACRSHAPTAQYKLLRKTCLVASLSKEIQIDLRCPDAERFDGKTQPCFFPSHLARRVSNTGLLMGTRRRPSGVLRIENLDWQNRVIFVPDSHSSDDWKANVPSFVVGAIGLCHPHEVSSAFTIRHCCWIAANFSRCSFALLRIRWVIKQDRELDAAVTELREPLVRGITRV